MDETFINRLSDERDDREDRHMVHVHAFDTLTLVADEHQHLLKGVTGPARLAGTSHVHRIRVRTSYHYEDGNGHWHWYDVMTGPSIETTNGFHTHAFDEATSVDDRHSHDVLNITAQAPDLRRDEEAEEEEYFPPIPSKVKTKNFKR